MSEQQWSCLDLTEHQFRALSLRPHPVTVDGQSISPDLPPRHIGLTELRHIVLTHGTGNQVKDAVWSYLVRMTRTDPDPWLIAAAGMMLPGLKNIAAKMRLAYPSDTRDLDSEILEAFLHALKLVDPNRTALHTQLYRAALRRGYQTCRREARQANSQVQLENDPTHPCAGNPDLALARAVRDGVVTIRQANLVSGVHLDAARRGEVARGLGISRDQARRELATATRELSTYLAAA